MAEKNLLKPLFLECKCEKGPLTSIQHYNTISCLISNLISKLDLDFGGLNRYT